MFDLAGAEDAHGDFLACCGSAGDGRGAHSELFIGRISHEGHAGQVLEKAAAEHEALVFAGGDGSDSMGELDSDNVADGSVFDFLEICLGEVSCLRGSTSINEGLGSEEGTHVLGVEEGRHWEIAET